MVCAVSHSCNRFWHSQSRLHRMPATAEAFESHMSEETRRDIVLIVIFSLVSAMGMASVFLGCRFLAPIVIVISDLYLSIVLLLAALRSDDDRFLRRHSWITRFFPSKTDWHLCRCTAFSGNCFWLCRSVCRSESLSVRQNAAGRSLHQLFHHGIHRLLAGAWLMVSL